MVELIHRKEAIEKLTEYYSERISSFGDEEIKEEIAQLVRFGTRGYEHMSNQKLTNCLEDYCILPTICEINGNDINFYVIN
jgi:hypothetical protein